MNSRPGRTRGHHPLPLLAGALVLASLLFFPLSTGSFLTDLPQIAIPLAVSLGIALYSIRLLQVTYDVERVKRIAIYGWTGTLTGSVGVWLLLSQLQQELSVGLLFDEALTVVSLASATGVVLGAHAVHERQSTDPANGDRLLTETVWTGTSEPHAITTAIATQIAELEGIDPVDIEPLYEHIDPDVFAQLQARDDSRWDIRFYTDDYEIHVSGHGTVRICENDTPDCGAEIDLSTTAQR